ncbi:hypothetical protein DYB34_005550, partial [Aphanomyces astaci]
IVAVYTSTFSGAPVVQYLMTVVTSDTSPSLAVVVAFGLLELLYTCLSGDAVRRLVNPIYAATAAAKGNELTMRLCKTASQKSASADRPVAIAAFRCLLSTVRKTQTQEKFYTQLLFADAIWPNIMAKTEDEGGGDEYSFETQTAAFPTKYLSRRQGGRSTTTHRGNSRLMDISTQFLQGSSLSQSTAPVEDTNDDEPMANDEEEDEDDVLEMDALNSHPCMLPLLVTIKHMERLFQSQWTDTTMPGWMDKVWFNLSTNSSTSVRLFLCKVVLNRPMLFAPYAAKFVGPLVELMLLVPKRDEFHYLLRDVCHVVVDTWQVDTISDDLSRFVNHLMAVSPHPSTFVLRDNLYLIEAFVTKFPTQCRFLNLDILLDMINADDAENASRHVAGMQLAAVLINLAFDASSPVLWFETSLRACSSRLETALLARLASTAHKTTPQLAADVSGLVLQHMPASTAFESGIDNCLQSFFQLDKPDRFLTCLKQLATHFPAIVSGSMLNRLASILPRILIQDTLSLHLLDIVHACHVDATTLFRVVRPHLPRLLSHHNPAVTLRLLDVLQKWWPHLTVDMHQVLLHGDAAVTVAFESSEPCRMKVLDFLLATTKGDVPNVQRIVLKALTDANADVRGKVASFWEAHLPSSCDDRLLALFGQLYHQETTDEWVRYAPTLWLSLSTSTPDNATMLFPTPLSSTCQFEPLEIDTAWARRTQSILTPLFSQDAIALQSQQLVDQPLERAGLVKATQDRVCRSKRQELARLNQEKAKGTAVSLFRAYRVGEFPDIQIPRMDVVRPLLVVASLHAATSSALFSALLAAVLPTLPSSIQTQVFGHFETLLESAQHNTLVVAALHQAYIGLLCQSKSSVTLLSPDIVGTSSISSRNLVTGQRILEELLIHSTDANVSTHAWNQLHHVLEMVENEPYLLALATHESTVPETTLAVEAQLKGDLVAALQHYKAAEAKYASMDKANVTILERQRWKSEQFHCLATLNRWDTLLDDVHPDRLWDQHEPFLEKHTKYFLEASIAIQDTSLLREFIDPILQPTRQQDTKLQYLVTRFPDLIACANMQLLQWIHAQAAVDEFYATCLHQWSSMPASHRLRQLQRLPNMVFLDDVLDVIKTHGGGATSSCVEKWKPIVPLVHQDSLDAWSTYHLIRNVGYESLVTATDEMKYGGRSIAQDMASIRVHVQVYSAQVSKLASRQLQAAINLTDDHKQRVLAQVANYYAALTRLFDNDEVLVFIPTLPATTQADIYGWQARALTEAAAFHREYGDASLGTTLERGAMEIFQYQTSKATTMTSMHVMYIEYLDKCLERSTAGTFGSLAKAMVETVLFGMALADKTCAAYFPRVLGLVRDHSADLLPILTSKMQPVPLWTCLHWSAQIMALLDVHATPFNDWILLHHPEIRLKEALRYLSDVVDDKKPKAQLASIVSATLSAVFDDRTRVLGNQVGAYNRQWMAQHRKHIEAMLGKDVTKAALQSARGWLSQTFQVMPGKYGIDRHWKAKLADFSDWLAQLDPVKTRIELPGQYTKQPATHTYILSCEPQLMVLPSKQLPKRLVLHASDERTYMYLVKGGEDLRLDQRIEQLFGVMNDILHQHTTCSRRQLSTRTYNVVPMTTTIGLVEWLGNTTTLKTIVEEEWDDGTSSKKKTNLLQRPPGVQYEAFWAKQRGKTYGQKVATAATSAVVSSFVQAEAAVPCDLLRRRLVHMANTSDAFFQLRESFATSLAAFNGCSYVLGIGDRHLDNFLLDERTGAVVGIDFGISFGAGASLLPVPELVPFRYTKQLRGVLQPHDASLLLQQDLAAVLDALRGQQQRIDSVMRVFLKEPLLEWQTQSKTKSKAQQKETPDGDEAAAAATWMPQVKMDLARRKLRGEHVVHILCDELALNPNVAAVLKPLQATLPPPAAPKHSVLSPVDQAKALIHVATAPNVLGRMFHGWSVALGLAYIVMSLTCSIYYLGLLKPAFLNDIWWANYTPSGYQALLIDIFNDALTTRASGELDLLSAVMDKRYMTPSSTTNVWPTYVRRLVFNELTSVEYAVESLRKVNSFWSMWILTPYCWVDFNQRYEIALTRSRQLRLVKRFSANGAVYMETMLRNVVWDEYMQSFGGDSGMFAVPIQRWLETSLDGRHWLLATSTARATTSEIEEAAYWKSHNISSFEVQWLNYWQTGISETMRIDNALGMSLDIPLKNVPRTDETWTSVVLYWMPINDLNTMLTENRSLVHAAPDSFLNDPPVNIELYLGIQPVNGTYPRQIGAFRATLGPFTAVDSYYVRVPVPLQALVTAFHDTLQSEVATNPALRTPLDGMVDSLVMYAPPASWLDPSLAFYGGNPVCLGGAPQAFVQQAFNFYDICTSQRPLTTDFNKYSVLFAGLATRNQPIGSLCDGQEDVLGCRLAVHHMLASIPAFDTVVQTLVPMWPLASKAVAELEISIMQYVSTSPSSPFSILRHGLVDSPLWSFYGWSMLYDWVHGQREVVSFQGDISTLVLISSADTPQIFTSNADSNRSASRVIYYIAVYASLVLVMVAVVSFLCAMVVANAHGPNLFWFNHIVGFVWVGRPVMFVRGLTAILLLSTAQVVSVSSDVPQSSSRFVLTHRSFLDILVISGEATWVTYVVNDILAVMTADLTKVCGPLSALLAWGGLVVLEMAAPVRPRAQLNRECASDDYDKTVVCTCGRLEIGSVDRVVLILGLQGAVCVVGLMAAWLLRRVKPQKASVETSESTFQTVKATRHALGIADSYLDAADESNVSAYHVDKVSCIMAGFLPLAWAGESYTFDVKMWLWHETKQPKTCTSHDVHEFRAHASSVRSKSTVSPHISLLLYLAPVKMT